jgi:hypothetical protein
VEGVSYCCCFVRNIMLGLCCWLWRMMYFGPLEMLMMGRDRVRLRLEARVNECENRCCYVLVRDCLMHPK